MHKSEIEIHWILALDLDLDKPMLLTRLELAGPTSFLDCLDTPA
jgi:hypothetical protein